MEIQWKRLGNNLSFSSAYHPQNNGQTNHFNRTLGNLLGCLTKEYGLTWDLVLHQAEFSYNDRINRTMCKRSFEIVYGIHPRGLRELRNLDGQVPNSSYAKYFSQSMKEVHEQVKQSLIDNTKKIKYKANFKKR